MAERRPASAERREAAERERHEAATAAQPVPHRARGVGNEQLCYSERTVKNVRHDIVTKLNARTRSQAAAYAVREGLI